MHAANTVKNDDLEQSLTLVVAGAVITGQLISVHRWHEEVGRTFGGDTSFTDEGADLRAERDAIADAIEKLDADDSTSRAADALRAAGQPTYIHMRNAKIVSGPSIYPEDGVLWRGRLSEVAGWSFGALTRSEPVTP